MKPILELIILIAPYLLAITYGVMSWVTVGQDKHFNELMLGVWMIIGSLEGIHFSLKK